MTSKALAPLGLGMLNWRAPDFGSVPKTELARCAAATLRIQESADTASGSGMRHSVAWMRLRTSELASALASIRN